MSSRNTSSIPGTISVIEASFNPALFRMVIISSGADPSRRVMWTESPKGSALRAQVEERRVVRSLYFS